MSDQIEIYDTTLRDGSQSEGVTFSLDDKLALTAELDRLGVAYIEGGWPGSNPKDEAYFAQVRDVQRQTALITAFGSTRRARVTCAEDANLNKLVASGADVCCIFGKTWDLHVTDALRIELPTNLAMIEESIAYLREETGKPVFYDAEHFFDGYKANPDYALQTLEAAHRGGAERLVLCDTNGGALPHEISEAIHAVQVRLPDPKLGIHVHNDGGLAVANTLAAVEAGCIQVQGTINGIGERCGNVDLVPVIANLEVKLATRCLPEGRLGRLTDVSRMVWERANMVGPVNQPFTGRAAFAHKGGIHVSAVQRNATTYEHIDPTLVGNTRRILVSELSGRSNVLAKLENRFPQLKESDVVAGVLGEIQDQENKGYSYEAAEASFELLVRRHCGTYRDIFDLDYYRVHGIGTPGKLRDLVEATVKLSVEGDQHLYAAEGNGPVDALSNALHAALTQAYPAVGRMHLVDYKVRVVNSADGTAAKVRVLTEYRMDHQRFATIGVHENIIEASWQALSDAFAYAVLQAEETAAAV